MDAIGSWPRWQANWAGLFLLVPAVLFANYEYPIAVNTIGSFQFHQFAAAAGAGIGLGLAVGLPDLVSRSTAWWLGLSIFVAGGTTATLWNAERPDAERMLVHTHVIDSHPVGHSGMARSLHRHSMRLISVDFQDRPLTVAVDLDSLPTFLWTGTPVVLSVYEGRLGHLVVERVWTE